MAKTKIKFAIITLLFIGLYSCKNTVKKENSTEETITKIDAHTSENSLDWNGTYKGTLPCADCEGIETTLTLHKDKTYTKQSNYLGKEDFTEETEGTFIWNDEGTEISLSSEGGVSPYYKVGENKLWHLNNDGKIIEGDLANHYILTKI